MDIERAMEILDPEHREKYDSIETVNEACRMGMEALRKLRETQEGDFISRDAVISEIKGVYEWHDFVTAERLIQHIKNLPTADAKPELASQSSAEGLKQKYSVFKSDTGEEVENCFVLKPAKDLAAVKALRAYAAATENRELSEDIYNWVGKPVSDSEQGDYIGREEIIKRIRSTKWPDYIKDVLIEEVTLIPAANVRPVVRGKWVLDSDPGEPWKYRCDQCGETTTDTCMGKPRANWCPLCGAYMGEEGETLRTQQQLRKRKYVSRDRVFIEFADWANETGATNTQNFSDRLRAIPTVDVSEDTKDV